MWPAQAKYEKRLAGEKSVRYGGSARIRLECLHFEESEVDPKNLERLESCLSKDCQRLDPYNHVPAVIDQHALDAVLRNSKVSPEALLHDDYPELAFPTDSRLECLHGRHWIQAAKQVLPLTEKWWVVDLYLSDVSRDLRTSLVEEYANEGTPTDGEIYRKIRQYHFEGNRALERRWWTRLGKHRGKALKQLLKNDLLAPAFDALLKVPGLWVGMRIKIWRYLDHVKEFWANLLEGNEKSMGKVDQATVKLLELRAPGASSSDADFVRTRVLGGQAFGAFDDEERRRLWSRLQNIDGMVPSLYTFFEDVKYLEVVAN